VCPSDYKTIDGDDKKYFVTLMQISGNIMIRFEGGEEGMNIVRAFGRILPLCFILFGIFMCKVRRTEKPTEEQTSET